MVPIPMPTIMVSDNGYCRADPISPRFRNGKMASIVVNDVIMIGFSLLCPAIMIARSSDIPPRRSRLMVSIFRIESLIMIPLITTMPIIDITLTDSPNSQSAATTKNTSTTISSRIIRGWMKLSNCAARMK